MFLSHGIMESTLIFHHVLGIVLYVLACVHGTYLYLSAIVLVQVRHLRMLHVGPRRPGSVRTLHTHWLDAGQDRSRRPRRLAAQPVPADRPLGPVSQRHRRLRVVHHPVTHAAVRCSHDVITPSHVLQVPARAAAADALHPGRQRAADRLPQCALAQTQAQAGTHGAVCMSSSHRGIQIDKRNRKIRKVT